MKNQLKSELNKKSQSHLSFSSLDSDSFPQLENKHEVATPISELEKSKEALRKQQKDRLLKLQKLNQQYRNNPVKKIISTPSTLPIHENPKFSKMQSPQFNPSSIIINSLSPNTRKTRQNLDSPLISHLSPSQHHQHHSDTHPQKHALLNHHNPQALTKLPNAPNHCKHAPGHTHNEAHTEAYTRSKHTHIHTMPKTKKRQKGEFEESKKKEKNEKNLETHIMLESESDYHSDSCIGKQDLSPLEYKTPSQTDAEPLSFASLPHSNVLPKQFSLKQHTSNQQITHHLQNHSQNSKHTLLSSNKRVQSLNQSSTHPNVQQLSHPLQFHSNFYHFSHCASPTRDNRPNSDFSLPSQITAFRRFLINQNKHGSANLAFLNNQDSTSQNNLQSPDQGFVIQNENLDLLLQKDKYNSSDHWVKSDNYREMRINQEYSRCRHDSMKHIYSGSSIVERIGFKSGAFASVSKEKSERRGSIGVLQTFPKQEISKKPFSFDSNYPLHLQNNTVLEKENHQFIPSTQNQKHFLLTLDKKLSKNVKNAKIYSKSHLRKNIPLSMRNSDIGDFISKGKKATTDRLHSSQRGVAFQSERCSPQNREFVAQNTCNLVKKLQTITEEKKNFHRSYEKPFFSNKYSLVNENKEIKILIQLQELGFTNENAERVIFYADVSCLEEALDYLIPDEEGLWNHKFVKEDNFQNNGPQYCLFCERQEKKPSSFSKEINRGGQPKNCLEILENPLKIDKVTNTQVILLNSGMMIKNAALSEICGKKEALTPSKNLTIVEESKHEDDDTSRISRQRFLSPGETFRRETGDMNHPHKEDLEGLSDPSSLYKHLHKRTLSEQGPTNKHHLAFHFNNQQSLKSNMYHILYIYIYL